MNVRKKKSYTNNAIILHTMCHVLLLLMQTHFHIIPRRSADKLWPTEVTVIYPISHFCIFVFLVSAPILVNKGKKLVFTCSQRFFSFFCFKKIRASEDVPSSQMKPQVLWAASRNSYVLRWMAARLKHLHCSRNHNTQRDVPKAAPVQYIIWVRTKRNMSNIGVHGHFWNGGVLESLFVSFVLATMV